MAVAAAVLVVGRACSGRGRPPLPRPLARRAVLRRRVRDARRGLHLERHPRPRARREGRAHALAADTIRTGERAARRRRFSSLQALVGLVVLVQFNRFTILLGIASLGVVAIYPLMKRVTWWPQIVLGLAFSWGALMGWAAVFSRLDAPALLLYAGSIAWVIGYDTIYAHQDREDDALIGVKSTARLFGARTRLALICFYALAVLLIGLSGAAAGAGPVFVDRLHLVRRASRLADRAPRHRRSGPVPATVQVEPRRRIDPVRRADRRCAYIRAYFLS